MFVHFSSDLPDFDSNSGLWKYYIMGLMALGDNCSQCSRSTVNVQVPNFEGAFGFSFSEEAKNQDFRLDGAKTHWSDGAKVCHMPHFSLLVNKLFLADRIPEFNSSDCINVESVERD